MTGTGQERSAYQDKQYRAPFTFRERGRQRDLHDRGAWFSLPRSAIVSSFSQHASNLNTIVARRFEDSQGGTFTQYRNQTMFTPLRQDDKGEGKSSRPNPFNHSNMPVGRCTDGFSEHKVHIKGRGAQRVSKTTNQRRLICQTAFGAGTLIGRYSQAKKNSAEDPL